MELILSPVAPGPVALQASPVDFPAALRLFDAYQGATGTADRTRHAYRRELTNFWCDWCALREIEVMEAGPADLYLYLQGLEAQGRKRGDATRALKSFYSWATIEHRQDNPAERLKVPREKLSRAPKLDGAHERALLRAAFRRDPRWGWSILLALNTGARVGSLSRVTLADVDLEQGTMHFAVAKGAKPYTVPLNPPAATAAHRLMHLARERGDDRLLGVGPDRFRQWVHEAQRLAGLPRMWPHLLRHEFSNRVAANGDPEAWRQLMNHSDLSQWARYVYADEQRMRDALPGQLPPTGTER